MSQGLPFEGVAVRGGDVVLRADLRVVDGVLQRAMAFVRESCWAEALPDNVGELGLDEQCRLMVEAWIEEKGSVL